ncbi:MAG: glycosyltransferase family 4 protein [Minisyncoccia bacterium]
MKVLVITKTVKKDSGWGRYSSSVVEEYKNFGIDYRVITEGEELLPLNSFFLFIKNCLGVRRISKEFDIVHAFDGWPYGVYAWFSTIGTNKKLFINAIGTYSVAPLNDLFKGLLLKIAYKNSNAVFAISNFLKEKILSLVSLKNIHTVYLASSDFPHLSQLEIDGYKSRFGISGVSPIILTVGEIKDRKGQYEVVEAIEILKNKYPNILYIMVGSIERNKGYTGEINNFILKKSLQKNIKIVSDAKNDSDLVFFYNIADVFVLNAKKNDRHFEGFGIVMLEAASFGKAVIGVSGTALEETMKDGLNGLLIRDQSKEGISETMKKVLVNKDKYASNSINFRNNFSWKKTASEYVKYYEK